MISYLLDVTDPKCLLILAINTWAVYVSFTTQNIISYMRLGGTKESMPSTNVAVIVTKYIHP